LDVTYHTSHRRDDSCSSIRGRLSQSRPVVPSIRAVRGHILDPFLDKRLFVGRSRSSPCRFLVHRLGSRLVEIDRQQLLLDQTTLGPGWCRCRIQCRSSTQLPFLQLLSIPDPGSLRSGSCLTPTPLLLPLRHTPLRRRDLLPRAIPRTIQPITDVTVSNLGLGSDAAQVGDCERGW